MKKLLLVSSMLCLFTGISAANANNISIGIGVAEPVYAPPAYVVAEPAPVYYYDRPYYRYDRHHNYDWRYWHERHDQRDHDHDHDDHHDNGRRH